MKTQILLSAAMICMSVFSLAQQSSTGNWIGYIGNQKISKKWNIWNEVQWRSYDAFPDKQQLMLRGGVGYDLSENNNNLLLGYAFISSDNYLKNTDEKVTIEEHRIFQQLISRQNFGRVYIQHRYRFEQRFLPDDFRLRLRYFLGINIPITTAKMEDKTLYASVYNEIFINTDQKLFDRNRIYGALGYAINKNLRVEAGYMMQNLETTKKGQFQIMIFNTIPFKKAE